MRVILKRASKLFAIFALLVALAAGIASLSGPRIFPNSADRVLLLVLQPAISLGGWIDQLRAQSVPPSLDRPESKDPVLFIHVILGFDAFIGLLLLYFVVCFVLAWCWTWIERRIAPQGTE